VDAGLESAPGCVVCPDDDDAPMKAKAHATQRARVLFMADSIPGRRAENEGNRIRPQAGLGTVAFDFAIHWKLQTSPPAGPAPGGFYDDCGISHGRESRDILRR